MNSQFSALRTASVRDGRNTRTSGVGTRPDRCRCRNGNGNSLHRCSRGFELPHWPPQTSGISSFWRTCGKTVLMRSNMTSSWRRQVRQHTRTAVFIVDHTSILGTGGHYLTGMKINFVLDAQIASGPPTLLVQGTHRAPRSWQAGSRVSQQHAVADLETIVLSRVAWMLRIGWNHRNRNFRWRGCSGMLGSFGVRGVGTLRPGC